MANPSIPGRPNLGNDRPIFIVGCARSGTTLLELMLHAHPRIAIPPETRFLMKLYDMRWIFGDLTDVRARTAVASDIVDLDESRFADLKLDKERVRQLIIEGPPTLGSAIGIVLREYAAHHGKPRWGDKRPNYIAHINRLLALFPDAQIIHIIRDGRDCVASLKRMQWWNHPVSYSIHYWMCAIEAGNRARGQLSPDQYFELRYEDLVVRPEAGLRALCRFLGEEFRPSMLEPHKVAEIAIPSWKLKSHHKLLTAETILTQTVGKWQQELTSAELGLMETVAEKQLRQYGYALSGKGNKVSKKRRESFKKLSERAEWKASEYEKMDALRAKHYGHPLQALLTKTQMEIFRVRYPGAEVPGLERTWTKDSRAGDSRSIYSQESKMVNPFILVLHGPICGGKTHFARYLGKRSRLFIVGTDKVKWCISDYSMKKYGGTGIVNTLMFRLIQEAVDQEFSVVVEGNLYLRKERLRDLAELCAERHLTFLQVNVEVPLEVAGERFVRRLERSIKASVRLAEKKTSNVPRRYQRYFDDRDPSLPNLDSSTMSLEEMAGRIDELLLQAQALATAV